jgi:hypothetical protein
VGRFAKGIDAAAGDSASGVAHLVKVVGNLGRLGGKLVVRGGLGLRPGLRCRESNYLKTGRRENCVNPWVLRVVC